MARRIVAAGRRRGRCAVARPADRAAARWCACGRSSSAWEPAARRRCCPLPPARRRHPARRLSRRRGGGRRLLALGFRGVLRFRLLAAAALRRPQPGRSAGRSAPARALVQFLRHALLEARHALGENRLALARQLLLGVEEIEQIGRIPIAHAAAARQRARQRDEDGRLRSDVASGAWSISHSTRFPAVSSSRPAAATPAAPRRASAGSAASRRHWQSDPAISASPWRRWRARPTTPAIRARYGERSRPARWQASRRCSMLG